jgi:hypothetical protein
VRSTALLTRPCGLAVFVGNIVSLIHFSSSN